MQYRDGKVLVRNGEDTVYAAWELLLSAGASAIPAGSPGPGGRVDFSAGGKGECLAHDLPTGLLTLLLASGADPAVGQTVHAPSSVLLESGVTTSGSTTAMLTMSGESWAADAYNGAWVLLRAGSADAEWKRIADTLTGPMRLQPDSAFADADDAGEAFSIYADATFTVEGLRVASPQNWLTAGITPGSFFAVDGIAAFVGVIAVAARTLTLAANWGAATQRGVGYSLSRDFSTHRGYPMPQPGDKQLHQILAEAIERIDADVKDLRDRVEALEP